MRRGLGWIALATLVLTGGADWPQFRGPEGTGVAPDGKPPTTWNKTDGVKWRTTLPGPGSSTPIVSGDRVFVTCYSGYGTDDAKGKSVSSLVRHLVCVDRATGKVRWTANVPSATAEDPYSGYIMEHGYASSTPVTDGEAVYVFFGKSGVLAFDLDGKQLWQQSVGTESDIRGWGSGSSLILHKNVVIVNASSETRGIVALEKKTGKQVWKAVGRKLSLVFGTPALVKAASGPELVVAMPGEAWGLNPDTGKLLWYSTIKPDGNICPAVIPGDGVAYITGGFTTRGSVAIKVGGKSDVTATNIAWASRTSSYVPTPVLHGGRLYCVTEDGVAICLKGDSGELVYEERLAVKGSGSGSRPYYASPVLADGRLYVISRRAGVFVLKAGDSFEQIVQNPPLDDSQFNASPSITGKQLFLRSNAALYCLEAR
jgi:outer membrane protein assembly factor BamB